MKDMELRFTGSVPGKYDELMVPLLFQPYADELASRARAFEPRRILETAAGTGVVTEALVKVLPQAELTATDLNPPMLDVAKRRVSSQNVRFIPADAQELSFGNGCFDLVVCQFGAMFFPDKVRAHSEALRVLDDRGHYLLATWNAIERNPLSAIAQRVLIDHFPENPPMFMSEGPFGYHDTARIESDLHEAGFDTVEIETVELSSRSSSSREAAAALCYGTPMGTEIDGREPGHLEEIFAELEKAFHQFEGPEGLAAPMSAHVVIATR